MLPTHLSMVQNSIHILQSPSHQSFNMRNQSATRICQTILHTGRYFSIYFPFNQSIWFQSTQCYSQHSLWNIFYRFMNITKTHGAVCVQRNKHQHRPLVSQAAKHISYRTISYRMKVFHSLTFCILLSSNNSYLYVTSLFSSTLLHFSN